MLDARVRVLEVGARCHRQNGLDVVLGQNLGAVRRVDVSQINAPFLLRGLYDAVNGVQLQLVDGLEVESK